VRISDTSWDIAIYRESNGIARIGFPRALTRALDEKGYNRVRLSITADGLLLIPYEGERRGQSDGVTPLPDWSGQ
jgi:hypothetical protein